MTTTTHVYDAIMEMAVDNAETDAIVRGQSMNYERIANAMTRVLEDTNEPACERVEAARILMDMMPYLEPTPEARGATFTEEQFELLSEYIYNAIHHMLAPDPGEPPSASETFLSEEQRYMMARERAERSGVELRRALNVENNT